VGIASRIKILVSIVYPNQITDIAVRAFTAYVERNRNNIGNRRRGNKALAHIFPSAPAVAETDASRTSIIILV